MNAERAGITDDAILNGRLRLYQPERGHRFGHDAILLAAATPARPGDRVVELGAGVGAASLALLARVPGIDVTLIEIDAALTALASDNIVRNGFAENARAVTLDVGASDEAFVESGLPAGSFDQVLMNPPFNDASLQPSPDPVRRKAHMTSDAALRTWLRRSDHLLREGGRVTLIWRADGQQDVLTGLSTAFGDVTILPVHPAPGQPPIRVLIGACKGAAASLASLPALILQNDNRRPSDAAEAVLRGGMPLPASIRSDAPAVPPSRTDERKP
jgi:tRNA1(Val) A37 N6-methylase TrmN6